MPITKSAKKALRQNIKRQVKNKLVKKTLKAVLKETRALAIGEKTEDAKKKLPSVYKALDKAAKTGLIKPNTAARKKSRAAKLINKIKIA